MKSDDVVIDVGVHSGHIERLSKVSNPLVALEEIVWNALDADSSEVSIEFLKNDLGGIESVRIVDNGDGICSEDAEKYFSIIGGSWKEEAKRTRRKKRLLHGKLGNGRFKAYAIGENVEWNTVFFDGFVNKNFKIYGSSVTPKKYGATRPVVVDCGTGTVVTITSVKSGLDILLLDESKSRLSERLALYILSNRDVDIIYNGENVDIDGLIACKTHLADSVFVYGELVDYSIDIIEWHKGKKKVLYICDSSGFVVAEYEQKTKGVGAYAAYVSSKFFDRYKAADIDVAAMNEELSHVIDAVKEKVKRFFLDKKSREAGDLIQEWRDQQIYPYTDTSNEGPITEMKRKVFDVLALNVNEYLSGFSKFDRNAKKLSFELIKNSLENGSQSLKNILFEVLDLPQDKIEDLNELLSKTTLSGIIHSAKIVSDRLEFLDGLERLIFERKVDLKERSQLHKILEQGTWIFGEEFSLSVSDKGLNAVLDAHLDILRKCGGDIDESDGVDDGGIVDLMLSAVVRNSDPTQHKHLIVELKRPSCVINEDVMSQVKKYALAVSRNERFKKDNVQWEFWALSNRVSNDVLPWIKNNNVYSDTLDGVVVRVMTWAQVLDRCKARMRFYKESLEIQSQYDEALRIVSEKYPKFVPESCRQ